jgi:tRNA threonylcarbamoyladenosine dehydratase
MSPDATLGMEPPADQQQADEADLDRRFAGVGRLLGEAAFARVRAAHVAVVGIGGVGSWAAEALARSGVGRLTLIDLDHVSPGNANRQIHALDGEFGKAKVLAMSQRINDINPRAQVRGIEEFVDEDNVARLIADVDLVIDCIDQVSAKAAMIAHGRAIGVSVITCGAAGGRADPTRIRCEDLARALGDPLLAKVRYRLRRRYGFPRESAARRPRFGVDAVYSDEPIRRPSSSADSCATVDFRSGLACTGYGSSVVVTAPVGFAAAARALQRIIRA